MKILKLIYHIIIKSKYFNFLNNETNDNYLNKKEIQKINKAAKKSIYRTPNLIVSTSGNKLDIRKISQKKSLILIDGNDSYGLKHINKRHGFYQSDGNWQDSNKKTKDVLNRIIQKLDYPSRFAKSTFGLFDYLAIADEIYCKSNLDIKNNKNPKILELYLGKTNQNQDNIKREYKLLVYKGTKIIHTLFPTDRKSKLKKRKGQFNFVRKDIRGKYHFLEKNIIISVLVPYQDSFDDERYIFIMRRSYSPKIDKFYIQVNEPKGKPAFTYFLDEKEHDHDFTNEAFENHEVPESLKSTDLHNIENIIGKIDKEYFPNVAS